METARLLIGRGADVNARNKSGDTPLHTAAWRGNMEVAKLLLGEGALINAKDSQNRTPLDAAVKAKYKAMIDLLRSYGGASGKEIDEE